MQEEEDAALARRLMEQEQQAEQQQAAQRHRVRPREMRSAAWDLFVTKHCTILCMYAASR
jgi:hypothetical protein